MQIQIATRHGQVSDATQEKIRAKVDRLQRYFERLTSIAVMVDLERRDAPQVELLVSAEHKHDFVARAGGENDNVLSAVDLVVEKMEQQLRKYKERVQDRHRSGPSRAAAPEEESP